MNRRDILTTACLTLVLPLFHIFPRKKKVIPVEPQLPPAKPAPDKAKIFLVDIQGDGHYVNRHFVSASELRPGYVVLWAGLKATAILSIPGSVSSFKSLILPQSEPTDTGTRFLVEEIPIHSLDASKKSSETMYVFASELRPGHKIIAVAERVGRLVG